MASLPDLRLKSIPARERLTVALDVPDIARARALVDAVGDEIVFYEVGLELATPGDYFRLLDWLLERGKREIAAALP